MFFDDEPLHKLTKAKRASNLSYVKYARKERRFLTDQELTALAVGSALAFDIEIFKNYCLFAFKHIASNSYFYVEGTTDKPLLKEKLHWIMWRFKVIGFNSKSYDIPITVEAVKGGDLLGLKDMSDAIILRDERFDRDPPAFNHIDLIEVAPLMGSLKLYAARLHCERMQELPVDPHKILSQEEIDDVREYCFNDLDNTHLLYNHLEEQIAMRETIGAEIGEDLRSKSDAQIAEAVISKEFERITGHRPRKSKEIDETPRTYTPPAYMQFRTPLLKQTLEKIASASFEIGANGYAIIPPEIQGLSLPIGNNVYRMSIGGLHSSETQVTLWDNETTAISDFDVASYYPKIILNGGIYPKNMGKPFLLIYKGIVVRRLSAKAAKRIIESDGLKITINGTFGKLGNPYSIMYSPELMLYVTLTGQLSLLMLIEHAALEGFEVVSANTDGIVFRYPREREAELASIVSMWELQTSFELEKTSYRGYFARDVNNYMTLKGSGEWKLKGAYSEKGSAQNSVLSRNPENFICVDAVKAFLANKTPIRQTVYDSADVRRFVTVRNVKGGAHKEGIYIGKTIRWYHAKHEKGAIHYVLTGNKVPNSDGARPLMQLGDFPIDLDRDWYVLEALAILKDIGYYETAKQKNCFRVMAATNNRKAPCV